MPPLIADKLEPLAAICRRYGVRRLDMFGSATGHGRRPFDPERSDLDFLVTFEDLPDMRAADQYFGLIEALEDLFGRAVDVVDEEAIRNPYFRQVINATREPLYAARSQEAAV